ncbi:M20/M25/M40 family metallo-hydrolase [Ligilactobacillus acidipiscis]|uniref:M20/M25/M40 family metallo-hydrolase n=1 Tax=Ligilactobacillus acidipiscis TaxID=89059 RepID=UPI0022E05233|nr:M20/M25/M40 family metallo-hydrolase [Ligilactobacillus acidipiscis]
MIISIGNGSKTLGFSGHEDIVSAGELSAWESQPFKAEVRNGRLYGRGVTEMKGGLVALIIAMLEFLKVIQSRETLSYLQRSLKTSENTARHGWLKQNILIIYLACLSRNLVMR